MSFLPEEAVKGKGSFAMAPMVDFLFLMLLFFATLAITRDSTQSTSIELVEIKPETASTTAVTGNTALKVIQIAIDSDGIYKWTFDSHLYDLKTPQELALELQRQYERGYLPQDKAQTQLLLTIDKNARWEAILPAILAIREAGFDVYPVYQPGELTRQST